MQAAYAGNQDIKGSLQLHNTDINTQAHRYLSLPTTIPTGYTALHIACSNGDYDTAAYLLDLGAKPNIRALRDTPLFLGSSQSAFFDALFITLYFCLLSSVFCHMSICQYVTYHLVTLQTNDYTATKVNNPSLVQLLLHHGANPEPEAIAFAAKHGFGVLLRMLMDAYNHLHKSIPVVLVPDSKT